MTITKGDNMSEDWEVEEKRLRAEARAGWN